MWLWILLLSNVEQCLQCSWPTADVLFVVDSTASVGEYNYELTKQFLSNIADQMSIGERQTRIAVAAYTPVAKHEFNLNSGTDKDAVFTRIQNLRYVPCLPISLDDCQPVASINAIASYELTISAGDRQPIPDVIIIISSVYRIPELLDREVLIAPVSPIHAFSITVGALDDFPSSSAIFTSSATTIKFSAYNYTVLNRLIEPLCNAANAFIRSDDDRYYGTTVFFGSTAGLITIICIISLILIALILFLCALCRYRKENEELRQQMEIIENDYQKAVAVNRRLQHIVNQYSINEKSRKELSNLQFDNSNADKQFTDGTVFDKGGKAVDDSYQRDHGYPITKLKPIEYTDSELEAYAAVKKYDRKTNAVVPLIDPETVTKPDYNKNPQYRPTTVGNDEFTEVYDERTNNETKRNEERQDSQDKNKVDAETNNGISENEDEKKDGKVDEEEEKIEYEEGDERSDKNYDGDEISEPDSFDVLSRGHLSANHPALSLPPVDIMLLMDCSSSIGINGFRQMRTQICKFLSDVNIAPGRSRVAVIIFASEPTVYFGFDKYYSYHSVARRIGTIPYIGGPTFLAKALIFAAGILYQEQNMKDGRHRKHKFMPTPHHDRLQVLIVVSDGYSEDNYEKVSNILFEKLNVKTAALVMRTYNKERLLPITRYEGAIFLIDQTEALNMWLWRQQRLWNENYADYVQKEKAFMAEQKKKGKTNDF